LHAGESKREGHFEQSDNSRGADHTNVIIFYINFICLTYEILYSRNFGREKLGQIKTVDPDSVECRLDKDDLVLEMNFTKDTQGKSWSCLTVREKEFKKKLTDLVKEYHQVYSTTFILSNKVLLYFFCAGVFDAVETAIGDFSRESFALAPRV